MPGSRWRWVFSTRIRSTTSPVPVHVDAREQDFALHRIGLALGVEDRRLTVGPRGRPAERRRTSSIEAG
jgi:hypothetical protein